MAQIKADYLGGDPERIDRHNGGDLVFSGAGDLSFMVQRAPNPLAPAVPTELLSLPASSIRAVSMGSANDMRGLSRGAAGAMIGGSIGGLIGMATGKRNTLLLVAAERDGFEFIATFAAQPDDARSLLTRLQADRKKAGKEPLRSVEDLAGDAATSAADEQLQLLRDIRGLLMEQNALLREVRVRVE